MTEESVQDMTIKQQLRESARPQEKARLEPLNCKLQVSNSSLFEKRVNPNTSSFLLAVYQTVVISLIATNSGLQTFRDSSFGESAWKEPFSLCLRQWPFYECFERCFRPRKLQKKWLEFPEFSLNFCIF